MNIRNCLFYSFFVLLYSFTFRISLVLLLYIGEKIAYYCEK
uniref:Uncharacterized protein n=1 Tax=Heterorhabditis bacteriophora TaxID=37862 RepID=A0A1I7WT52_HETBA